MKRDVQKQSPTGVGKGFWLLLGAVVLIGATLLAARAWRSGASDATVTPESEPGSGTAVANAVTDQAVTPEPVAGVETNPLPATDRPATVSKASPVPPPRIPAPELPAPSAESRQLVNGICQLDPAAGPMTAEGAAQWKQNFEQLVQGGATSVTAIGEYLKLNQDWVFGAGDAAMLGYGSARTAMLDALVRIGGAEGISALDLFGVELNLKELELQTNILSSLIRATMDPLEYTASKLS